MAKPRNASAGSKKRKKSRKVNPPPTRKGIPPSIRRITVDERFGDSLVRLVIAHFADIEKKVGEKFLVADLSIWGEEEEEYVDANSFLKVLGVDEKDISLQHAMKEVIGDVDEEPTRELLWRSLEEGQVFLSGSFRTRACRYASASLDIHGDSTNEFLRIDRMEAFKSECKHRYTSALCGREG